MTTRLDLFNWLKNLISDPGIILIEHQDESMYDRPDPTVAIEISTHSVEPESKSKESGDLGISISVIARSLSQRETEVERIRGLLRDNETPDGELMQLTLIESETNADGGSILFGSRMDYETSLLEDVNA